VRRHRRAGPRPQPFAFSTVRAGFCRYAVCPARHTPAKGQLSSPRARRAPTGVCCEKPPVGWAHRTSDGRVCRFLRGSAAAMGEAASDPERNSDWRPAFTIPNHPAAESPGFAHGAPPPGTESGWPNFFRTLRLYLRARRAPDTHSQLLPLRRRGFRHRRRVRTPLAGLDGRTTGSVPQPFTHGGIRRSGAARHAAPFQDWHSEISASREIFQDGVTSTPISRLMKDNFGGNSQMPRCGI
jgi:hypothetical protein